VGKQTRCLLPRTDLNLGAGAWGPSLPLHSRPFPPATGRREARVPEQVPAPPEASPRRAAALPPGHAPPGHGPPGVSHARTAHARAGPWGQFTCKPDVRCRRDRQQEQHRGGGYRRMPARPRAAGVWFAADAHCGAVHPSRKASAKRPPRAGKRSTADPPCYPPADAQPHRVAALLSCLPPPAGLGARMGAGAPLPIRSSPVLPQLQAPPACCEPRNAVPIAVCRPARLSAKRQARGVAKVVGRFPVALFFPLACG
jgi:hypothetical protein